ncbi:MAG: hypothetical protein K2N67_06030, partial [Mucispirillum sp.]|nr:hypothetical protein [Mucispirillum sp.]
DNIFIMSYNYAASISNELNRVLWNMAVFDEAHKLRNSYRSSNRLGQTLIPALKDVYKVLLTATPMQNNLSELYGLAAVIDEHILGDIKIFRSDYISNDNNFEELKYRLRQFYTRTLRKDVTEYIKYTSRYPIVFKFSPSDLEQELYNNISAFLQRDDTYSVPIAQKHIVTLVVRKVLASSTTAVIGTLQAILKRLEIMRINAVEKQYEFDKSVKSYFISDDDDDMLALMDEYMDDYIDEDGYEGTEEKRIDIYKLNKEIEEINGFIDTAYRIETDTKAKTLLEALENGFKHTVELGGNKKALIFTESVRTQKFLKEYLENHGYAGRLVIFNGGGKGSEITAIYNEWLERNRYSGRCSGSVTADKRNAIIEYFRDNADIMIATEAAAEGVNLQFCSLVINYDLPWNPTRIMQRVGRINRVGTEFDRIYVFNFFPTSQANAQLPLKDRIME